MPVRPPIEVGHAVAGNTATLTEGVPAGWDLVVVGAWEPDGGAFLSSGGCTDSAGNVYHLESDGEFHVSPGNIQATWDARFLVSSAGDAGYLGRCCYSTRVVHPLSPGDTITIPRATHIGALKTKGLTLSVYHPLYYGLSGGEGTLSDDSDPQREWSIGVPFGTTGVPAIAMQRGDLLIGHGVFRFPFTGTDTPDYAVEPPPGWHLHANWLGQAAGAAAPDGMILTSLRANSVGLYDFRGSIGATAEAIYQVVVLGFRGTPGAVGSGPSSAHSQHGRYVVATEESNRIRIRRAASPVPPFETDTYAGPTGATSPRLAWNPQRDVLQLLYADPDGSAQWITSDDSGQTWSDPTPIMFPETATFLDQKTDEHGFTVCAAFTEEVPATGVGFLWVARKGPADTDFSEPVIVELDSGPPPYWEPVGFTLSPANDYLNRWLLTATQEGDDLDSQFVSYDRCLTFKPV